MSFDSRSLDDYNDVASRMAEFFHKYPEGSFQTTCNFIEVDGGRSAAVVQASAYRTPDDPRPGQGLAYEFIPGKTPFTKDSELQNAETAAWGRAVLAVGAADAKKGIASREEVRNRTAESNVVAVPDNAEGRAALREFCETTGANDADVAKAFTERMGTKPRLAANEDIFAFLELVTQGLVPLG